MGSGASKGRKTLTKDDIQVIKNTTQPTGNREFTLKRPTKDALSVTRSELSDDLLVTEYQNLLDVVLKPDDDNNADNADKKSTKSNETLDIEATYDVMKDVTSKMRDVIKAVIDVKDSDKASDDGYFPERTIALIAWGYNAVFATQGLSLEWSEKYNNGIVSALLKSKAIDCIREPFMYYAEHDCNTTDEQGEKKIDERKWRTFHSAGIILSAFSDHSDELANYLASYTGFLHCVKLVLTKEAKPHIQQKQTATARDFTYTILILTYNISKRDVNVRKLRELEFTSTLEPYLHSAYDSPKLAGLSTIASLVDEQESAVIIANQEIVEYLLLCLEKGIKSTQRRSSGWTVHDCVFALRMLSRNDTNKKMLQELGTVEILVLVVLTGNDAEKYESILALWALAFDPEIRQFMVEDEGMGVVELLHHVKTTTESENIKKACNGVLWTIREELKESKKHIYQNLGHQLEVPKSNGANKNKKEKVEGKEQKSEKTSHGHIMLSYQWDNQKTLIVIRDRLQSSGFNVWMDIDQMEGSTIQSMAEAVENSSIVLMAMSNRYKNSPNCRAEAEYAYKNKKIIIPLLMERGYSPDGWLGFILGTKLFFDFSGKYEFEDKMGEMLRHVIKSQGQIIETDENTPRTMKEEDTNKAKKGPEFKDSVQSTTESYEKIQTWSQSDVQNWLLKHDLNSSVRLTQLTPGEICLMLTMRKEAPEFFYRSLRKMLHVKDFLTMSKLVAALNELDKE